MRDITKKVKFGFGGDGELTSSLAGKKLKGLTTQTRTVAKAEVVAARTWTATEHRFPFDEQECLFRFSSWTYDANKLNLTLRSTDVNTEGYMLNGVSLLENYLLLSFSQSEPVLLVISSVSDDACIFSGMGPSGFHGQRRENHVRGY